VFQVVDVRGLVRALAPLERGHCALSLWGGGDGGGGGDGDGSGKSARDGEPAEAKVGWLSVGGWAATLQQWYDPQCGLCVC
jgi:hypothetical protein